MVKRSATFQTVTMCSSRDAGGAKARSSKQSNRFSGTNSVSRLTRFDSRTNSMCPARAPCRRHSLHFSNQPASKTPSARPFRWAAMPTRWRVSLGELRKHTMAASQQISRHERWRSWMLAYEALSIDFASGTESPIPQHECDRPRPQAHPRPGRWFVCDMSHVAWRFASTLGREWNLLLGHAYADGTVGGLRCGERSF